MAIFTAYFDASATKKKTVTTVAGFVSRTERWGKFEDEWKSLLPSSVDHFHMTDFVSSQDGWESWKGPENSERRAVLISNLVRCIKKCTNRGFAHTVRKVHFDDCNAEYMLGERFINPYVLLGLSCLGGLAAWAKKKGVPKDHILCIFEDGDIGQGKLLGLAKADGFNVIPQAKKHIRAFDACDLLAWKARTTIDNTWENKEQLQSAVHIRRILESLDLTEGIVKDPKGVGILNAVALKRTCISEGIPKRIT
jgi:hypothetical protein